MYNLKGLRKEVNKTQSEIAVLFGCKQNNISMQEKSDRDLTTEQMDVLRKNFGEEIVNKYYYKISTSNVETINNERESTLKSSSDSFREKNESLFMMTLQALEVSTQWSQIIQVT